MKNIAAPKVDGYPATVSSSGLVIGDHVRKGDRLCVLTLKTGRKIAINAPVSGQIEFLSIRNDLTCAKDQLIASIDDKASAPAAQPTPPKQTAKPPKSEPLSQRKKPKRRDTAQHPQPQAPKPQINFFIWQGWGWLVPIIYITSFLAILIAMDALSGGDMDTLFKSKWMLAAILLLPAVLVGLFGLWSNKRKRARTNNRVSKFLFIKSEIWAVPLIALGIGGVIYGKQIQKERAEDAAFWAGISAIVAEEARISEQERIAREQQQAEEAAEAYRNATYSFTLCNNHHELFNAAIAIKERGNAAHMRMRSWYTVTPGNCVGPFIGRFDDTSETEVYYHAVTPDWGTWGGRSGALNTIDFCLPRSNEDFLLSHRLRCYHELENRTFKMITLTRESPELIMNLN